MRALGARPVDSELGMAANADPWRTLRLRRRWLLGLGLGWLPFAAFLTWLQDTNTLAPWSPLLALPYLGCFVFHARQLHKGRCPRCGGPFTSLSRLKARALWYWQCDTCNAAIGDPVS